jgi:hypothetical protein
MATIMRVGYINSQLNAFCLLLVIILLAKAIPAADVSLAWDASVSEGILGYKVYTGLASRTYRVPITIGNQTTYTVMGLLPGATWYFAVTAYDAAGNESDYSNEVFTAITTGTNRCDLNGDSKVDALDIQKLVNFLLSGTAQPSGDINADSKVNVLDLQILANVILGRQSCPGQ